MLKIPQAPNPVEYQWIMTKSHFIPKSKEYFTLMKKIWRNLENNDLKIGFEFCDIIFMLIMHIFTQLLIFIVIYLFADTVFMGFVKLLLF